MSTPVEEIKERLNIVDIVGEYVTLKKAGANHKGLCPFHGEKTPSFTVSEPKQFFHCFGCGKGGDIFTFLQEVESVEFAEALRMLAQKAGVELKKTDPRDNNERTRLLDCLDLATSFFSTALKESKEGERARTYLEERAVSSETTTLFQIGYSGDSWDALMQFLKKRGFTNTELEHAGLVVPSPKAGGYYDRFRGRLMFPIHNTHGNVIGFGARILESGKHEAKYLNSPQTQVYNKSAVLYGLDMAKHYIKKMDATMIVEGYMDVVTAHQAKFRNVVASSGTALTEEQIRLLKRFSNNVILAFDADAAGLSAAWRGMQLAIQQGMNIKVMNLPQGSDPDELIRQDAQHFRKLAVEAKPFMEYAFDTVLAPLDLMNVQHKKKAASELLPMISLFPDKIEQTHYLQRLATLLHVDEQILRDTINRGRKKTTKLRPKTVVQEPITQPVAPKNPKNEALSERLMALLSLEIQNFPVLLQRLHVDSLEVPHLREVYKYLESQYNQSGSIERNQLVFSNEKLLLTWQTLELIGEELYSQLSLQERQQELLALLDRLERDRIKRRLQDLSTALSSAEASHDNGAIERLSTEFRILTDELKKLG
ncbi:MAG: DNA primase [Candidatus Kerfeldbacteria bacterium CG15_BIG_FIL_POST_REV_8_21_14_020_45_12]|uniref:DNA primase n=1 Tax=Candidatus Kerfeldbacteria bacterium CG15_BIG_FIL_POST_REV_8_21_14_020_45_12 TaxID=2014247 RepID=A0A2M7H4T6_9BACT|nr:MAG: DNA primase [Candidatus Kerfeldbacteria bacterium CG15_BIG_FIL_POST_REV_8_21_14_020_45_12]